MIVLLRDGSPRAVKTFELLQTWHAAGLLVDFISINVEDAAVTHLTERVARPVGLASALAGDVEEVQLLCLFVRESPGDAEVFVERVNGCRREVSVVLPASAGPPPLAVLVALQSVDDSVPEAILQAGWDLAAIAAESRKSSGEANEFSASTDELAAHVAHSLAAVAGLYTGGDPSSLPIGDLCSPHLVPSSLRLVQGWTRIVDVGPVADHVFQRALPTTPPWPNPAPKTHEESSLETPLGAGTLGDHLLTSYLKKHQAILGLTVLERPIYTEPLVSIPRAILDFLLDLLDSLRRLPARLADHTARTAYDWLKTTTERITGRHVLPYDVAAPDTRVMETLLEPRIAAADAVGVTWADMCRSVAALIDGSAMPDYCNERVLITATGRRAVILDPVRLVPDPTQVVVEEPTEEAEGAAKKSVIPWTSRIGEHINRLAVEAEKEAVRADALVGPTPDGTDDVAEPSSNWRKAGRRFILRTLLLSAVLSAVVVVVLLTLHPFLSVLIVAATPLLWFGLTARAGLRLYRLRRKMEREAIQAALDIGFNKALIGVRRSDAARLGARLVEFYDWERSAGWWAYHPWLPQPLSSDPVSPPKVDLPPACELGAGSVLGTTLDRIAVRARSTVFSSGWVSRVEQSILKTAALEYLAQFEPGGGTADLPDPYQDTRRGDESLRISVIRQSEGVFGRERRGRDAQAEVVESVGTWKLGELVHEVIPSGAADTGQGDVLGPVAGWAAAPSSLAPLAARLRPSVVRIERTTESGVAVGSGVVVEAGKLVVTNAHVVGRTPDPHIMVISEAGTFAGQVVAWSKTTDLALVRLDASADALPAAELAHGVDQGAVTVTLGYPFALEGEATFSWGLVGALSRRMPAPNSSEPYAEHDLLQCSYPAGPGASGSGVFDLHGKLVGIHTAGAADTSPRAAYISFAVPEEAVRELIAGEASRPARPSPPVLGRGGVSLDEFMSDLAPTAAVGGLSFLHAEHITSAAADRTADVVTGLGSLDVSTESVAAQPGIRTVVSRTVCVLSPRLIVAPLPTSHPGD